MHDFWPFQTTSTENIGLIIWLISVLIGWCLLRASKCIRNLVPASEFILFGPVFLFMLAGFGLVHFIRWSLSEDD